MDPELGPLFHRCPGNTLENQPATKKAFKVELSNKNPKFEWGLTVPKRKPERISGFDRIEIDSSRLLCTSLYVYTSMYLLQQYAP